MTGVEMFGFLAGGIVFAVGFMVGVIFQEEIWGILKALARRIGGKGR